MTKYCPGTSYYELDWRKNFTCDITATLYRTRGLNLIPSVKIQTSTLTKSVTGSTCHDWGGRQSKDPKAFPFRTNFSLKGQEINRPSPCSGDAPADTNVAMLSQKKILGQAGLTKLLNLFRPWECDRAPQKRLGPGTLYPPLTSPECASKQSRLLL